MREISLIVAHDLNRGIGYNNTIPWNLKEDMNHFRNFTMNKTVVMGRHTWESIGRPLPNRTNVVISSKRIDHKGVITLSSLDDALLVNDHPVCFIGGTRIYKQCLPYVNTMSITSIQQSFTCDTFFPIVDFNEWHLVEQTSIEGQLSAIIEIWKRDIIQN